jgi:molybdopterin biosynthesis enzyme
VLSGAPVEPGNLLALAYLPDTPVICVPGCAKSLKHNVVDLVLPRLLLGDRLDRRDIAGLALGGFLTATERAGEAM